MSNPPPPPPPPQGHPSYPTPPQPQPQQGPPPVYATPPYAAPGSPAYGQPGPPKPKNPVGVWALSCGIAACVVVWVGALAWLWILTMLAAITLGIIGLAIKNRPKGAAAAGLSLGVGSIVLAVIAALVLSFINTASTSIGSVEPAPSNYVELPQQTGEAQEPSDAASEPAEDVAAPPADARQPVTWEGQGDGSSARAALEGDYAVAWETFGDCTYYGDLEDGGEDLFSASDITTGTNYIYGIAAGEYYIDVITGPAPGCGWKVTLTPQ